MAIEDSVAICKSTPESDISFLDPSGLYVIKPLPPVGQNLCLSLFHFFFRNENAICLLDSTCCTMGLPQGGSHWTCGLFFCGLFHSNIHLHPLLFSRRFQSSCPPTGIPCVLCTWTTLRLWCSICALNVLKLTFAFTTWGTHFMHWK